MRVCKISNNETTIRQNVFVQKEACLEKVTKLTSFSVQLLAKQIAQIGQELISNQNSWLNLQLEVFSFSLRITR